MSGSSSPVFPSATRRRTRGGLDSGRARRRRRAAAARARGRAPGCGGGVRDGRAWRPSLLRSADPSYRSAPMDLELSEEQRELRDGVGACSRSSARLRSRAPCTSAARAAQRSGGSMVALGWPGVAIAEAHGGLGLGAVELCLVAEELGRAVAPGPFLATATQLAPLLQEAGAAPLAARPAAAHRGGEPHRQRGARRGRSLGPRRRRVPRAARWRAASCSTGRKTGVFDGATRRRDRGGRPRAKTASACSSCPARAVKADAAHAARPDARRSPTSRSTTWPCRPSAC